MSGTPDDVHNPFVQFCNAEISKLITGGTLNFSGGRYLGGVSRAGPVVVGRQRARAAEQSDRRIGEGIADPKCAERRADGAHKEPQGTRAADDKAGDEG